MNEDYKKYFSGKKLYGDDFCLKEIENWYRDEENAYYDLVHQDAAYEYHEFNYYYAFSKIRDRYFKSCLAFGCANGDDVSPLADRVERYIAIEPAEKWWSDTLAGRPAQYLKPEVCGDIPLGDASVDLAICLGVLHHVPNVSHVIGEISRVLDSNGLFVVREPIFSMGDWRKKRKGLTSRERGIPAKILRDMLIGAGFEIISRSYCMVPTTWKIGGFFGIKHPFDSPLMVRVDRIFSILLSWNLRYHRRNLLQKLAPTSIYIVARKRVGGAAQKI